ncbi:hypothetical protein ABIQ69_01270 [Agromyces sp. G08B096]|uniref:Dinucleotide-utilizing enzyme n=1 Tax=Agromyces sp. G08B096 TaxID=3156399 RepID=A0AAU7WAV0_9MICO
MSASRPSPAVSLIVPAVTLVASAAVTVVGALWTASANATLNAALVSGTGTAADVYGSQSAIVVSSGLLTAGIVGLVVSLALIGALIGFGALSKPAREAAADPFDDDFDDEVDLVEAEPVARVVPEAGAPVASAPGAADAPEAPDAPEPTAPRA